MTDTDALRRLVQQWREEADDIDDDGDFCCALTRRHDADALEAELDRGDAGRAAGAPLDEPLKAALLEICLRIEAKAGDCVETHRELSAYRHRLIQDVYAIAESALAAGVRAPQEEKEPKR